MKMFKWVLAIGLTLLTANAQANSSSTSSVGIDQGASRMFVGSGGTFNIEAGGQMTAGEVTINPTIADGVSWVRVARCSYDFSTQDGTTGTKSCGLSIPANAVVLDGVVDVKTGASSVNGTGTIALALEAANDIVSASQVGSGWTSGFHDIVPIGTAVTAKKTTVARGLSIVIGTQTVQTGKFTVFLRYMVSQ